LYAGDNDIAAAASRDDKILSQFPFTIDAVVAMVDMLTTTLNDACDIVGWSEVLGWPQHRELIMIASSNPRPMSYVHG
jgi:hypothetical protein